MHTEEYGSINNFCNSPGGDIFPEKWDHYKRKIGKGNNIQETLVLKTL